MKTTVSLTIIFLTFISFYLLNVLIDSNKNNFKILTGIEDKRQNHIKIIDLSKEVCPKEKYDSFNCVNLLEIYISPILCIHDTEIDFTSKMINRDRIKEKNLIEFFLDYLVLNTESLFIDIGSHVGLYSMFAAKLGRDVVAVEAFSENIFRLHKAANLNKVIEKITLLNNAISDRKGLTVELKLHKNIGQQSIFGQNQKDSDKSKNSVKTIVLDDLIDALPKDPNGKEYKKAILKIDIEGFEPYAFLNAAKIFKKLDFELIIMEWQQLNRRKDTYLNEIEKMIAFLTKNGLVPYANRKMLDIKSWSKWPFDIYWLKQKVKNN